MDWLDLLAVQGTLKSLLQHHSSKASILQRSGFFTVQLSHPYMTTGKTIALTRRTLVGKKHLSLCSLEGAKYIFIYQKKEHKVVEGILGVVSESLYINSSPTSREHQFWTSDLCFILQTLVPCHQTGDNAISPENLPLLTGIKLHVCKSNLPTGKWSMRWILFYLAKSKFSLD